MYKIVYYERQNGRSPIEEYLVKLPEKHRIKALNFIELLAKNDGILPRQYVAPVRAGIKELRIQHSPLHHRIFFAVIINKTIVLLHAITKKTNKLNNKDIEQTMANLEDYKKRL